MKFPTLFKRTSSGAIQTWTIQVDGNTFFTKSGQLDGKVTQSKPTICIGKNLDKLNQTTPEEQALSEAQSKYDKQLKSKYMTSIKAIDTHDFISPTLAHLLKNRKKPMVFPAALQTKYNGVCSINDNVFGSRSRKGEIFYNIKHINKELDAFFKENPDIVLHGELFNNDLRRNLNRLIKLVAVTRKEKDLTPELIQESEEIVRLYVYDGYVKGQQHLPFHERIKYIHERIQDMKYVFPAETVAIQDEAEIKTHFDAALLDGQEGVIVRMIDSPYEIGKRSYNIIKFKESESEEFLCIGFEEGTGNWAGIAKKAVMVLPNGKTFNCNMSGTQDFNREVWNNQEKWIGKYYTCDFQCYSEYGIPQIGYTGLIERSYE